MVRGQPRRGQSRHPEALHGRPLHAAVFATAGFRAWAGQARAAVLIAQSQHAEALPVLQAVVHEYRSLHARYDTARVYELLAQAHRGLGQSSVAAAGSAVREGALAPVFTPAFGAVFVRAGTVAAAFDVVFREVDLAGAPAVFFRRCNGEGLLGRSWMAEPAARRVRTRVAAASPAPRSRSVRLRLRRQI